MSGFTVTPAALGQAARAQHAAATRMAEIAALAGRAAGGAAAVGEPVLVAAVDGLSDRLGRTVSALSSAAARSAVAFEKAAVAYQRSDRLTGPSAGRTARRPE